MIDLHTHILPAIDDGSRDIDESMGLIAEEGRQGVSTIVATPHFYAQEMSVKGFLERREEAFRRVMERLGGEEPSGRAPASLQTQADPNRAPSSLQTKGHPRILKGAEVYFFPGMGAAEALPSLTMEGTNVLLLEMPFAQWTGTIYEEVRRIIKEQHLTILLAHLERFYQFQKDRSVLEKVLALPGVQVQVNTGALADWKRRRIIKKILQGNNPVVLGSDCHNMRSRQPNLAAGREIIEKKLGGQAMLDQLDANAQRLLGKAQN